MPRRKSIPDDDGVGSAQRAYASLVETSETLSMSMISRVMSEMGKRGGSKGGKMRLVTLTPARRSEIASLAAKKRWAKKRKKVKA
jgi:hypothetical protein